MENERKEKDKRPQPQVQHIKKLFFTGSAAIRPICPACCAVQDRLRNLDYSLNLQVTR